MYNVQYIHAKCPKVLARSGVIWPIGKGIWETMYFPSLFIQGLGDPVSTFHFLSRLPGLRFAQKVPLQYCKQKLYKL